MHCLSSTTRIDDEAERSRRFARNRRMRPGTMAQQPSIGIIDFHVALVQSAELERSEVHVPDPVADLFECVFRPDVVSQFGGT
jgi:hypothetical protein